MERQYIIKPFESVGILKFGMTQVEVEEAIGKPNDTVDDKIMNEIRETYEDFVLVFIRKKLVDVRFYEKMNLNNISIVFDDIEINKIKNLGEFLSSYPKSKASELYKGFINFYGLGINIGGFGTTKLKNGKEIRAFQKNRIKYYELYLKA